jgi:hypothetical protein
MCPVSLVSRIFQYNLTSNKIYGIDEQPYNRCLLGVKYVHMQQNDSFIICTATDGALLVHRLADNTFRSNEKPMIFKNVHQSGINSIDIRVIDDQSLLLATAGDDTRLSLTKLNLNGNQIHQELLVRIDMTHASSIMGKSN